MFGRNPSSSPAGADTPLRDYHVDRLYVVEVSDARGDQVRVRLPTSAASSAAASVAAAATAAAAAAAPLLSSWRKWLGGATSDEKPSAPTPAPAPASPPPQPVAEQWLVLRAKNVTLPDGTTISFDDIQGIDGTPVLRIRGARGSVPVVPASLELRPAELTFLRAALRERLGRHRANQAFRSQLS